MGIGAVLIYNIMYCVYMCAKLTCMLVCKMAMPGYGFAGSGYDEMWCKVYCYTAEECKVCMSCVMVPATKRIIVLRWCILFIPSNALVPHVCHSCHHQRIVSATCKGLLGTTW